MELLTELHTEKAPKIEKIHTFYKEDGKWYIDCPETGKTKEDLEIIGGGQFMLEHIAGDRTKVTIRYSNHSIPRANFMVHLRNVNDDSEDEGALYRQYFYNGTDIQVDIPFCDTIKMIFGYIPVMVYWQIL